jgi:hypothetical protein
MLRFYVFFLPRILHPCLGLNIELQTLSHSAIGSMVERFRKSINWKRSEFESLVAHVLFFVFIFCCNATK